jgi:hypothetical protein
MKELNGTRLISIRENCKVYTTNELLLPERHVASKGQNHLDHVLNFKLINYIDKNINTHLVISHYISKLTDLYMYSISTSDVIRKGNNEIMNNTIVRLTCCYM